MPDGVEQALADADLALDQLSPESGWIPAALAHARRCACAARRNRSRDGRPHRGDRGGAGRRRAADVVIVAQAQLALLAAKQGAWGEAGQRARAAQALVEEAGLGDYSTSALAHVATARVALHEARPEDARAALTRAHRLRPLLDHGLPWLTVQVGLELTRAHLALAEAGAARTILTETERVLELRPHMGSLVEDARELRDRVAATSGSDGAWAMSLTGAELRLLPYLATHLMFPEIASRLFISRNTVKTEAVSIYRKLGVSSRSRGDRACRGGRAPGELDLPAAGQISPRRDDAPADRSQVQYARRQWTNTRSTCGGSPCTTTRLLDALAVDGSPCATSVIDEKTAALVRVAATIAVDAAPYSFQHAIALALAAGATSDEIVASLEAVTPVTGAARVVQCAPKVALALGYDVDAALERRDP